MENWLDAEVVVQGSGGSGGCGIVGAERWVLSVEQAIKVFMVASEHCCLHQFLMFHVRHDATKLCSPLVQYRHFFLWY